MAFKFFLLTLALLGAAHAEYNYNGNTSDNEKLSTDVNSLEQNASNSNEDYRTNYQTPHNNAQNSQATPKGYDYSGQVDELNSNELHDVRNAASVTAALFPVPLPTLREQRQPEIYPPASYNFNYAVNDEITGDIKEHTESRDGNVVRGSYSLVDPDGYKRTVTYTADAIHGFNAVVNRVPYALKKVAVAAPAVLLDERSPLTKGSSISSASASANVKSANHRLSAGSGDSYVNAANNRDAAGGIYA